MLRNKFLNSLTYPNEQIDILPSLYYDLIKICDITLVLVSDSFFSSFFFPLLSNSRVNNLTPASSIFSPRSADPLNYKFTELHIRNLLLLESLSGKKATLSMLWTVIGKTGIQSDDKYFHNLSRTQQLG